MTSPSLSTLVSQHLGLQVPKKKDIEISPPGEPTFAWRHWGATKLAQLIKLSWDDFTKKTGYLAIYTHMTRVRRTFKRKKSMQRAKVMVLFFLNYLRIREQGKRERESDRNISILSCSLENIDCSRRPSRNGFATRNARTRRRTPTSQRLLVEFAERKKEVEHGG